MKLDFHKAFEELISRGLKPVIISGGGLADDSADGADVRAQEGDKEGAGAGGGDGGGGDGSGGSASRVLRFVLSTSERARDGDVILVEGWETKNFRRNPVVLAFHDRRRMPVARSLREWIDEGKKRLMAEAEFLSAEKNPDAERFFRMYKDGDMRAVSVSWDPIRWRMEGDGEDRWIVFERQDLLEYSLVTVPADPGALLVTERGIVGPGGADVGIPARMDGRIVLPLGASMEVERKAYSVPEFDLPDKVRSRSVVPYSAHGDVPVASRDRRWNAAAARRRLRRWATEGGEIDFNKYRRGFVFVRDMGERLGDYVGPHHDIVDGRFVMVPRGVFALAQRIQQGRIGIPDEDMPAVRRHVEREYERMGLTAPWKRAAGQHYERLLAAAREDESLREAVVELARSVYGEWREPEEWEGTLRPDQEADPIRREIGAVVTSYLDSEVVSPSDVRMMVDELAERLAPRAGEDGGGDTASGESGTGERVRLKDPEDLAGVIDEIAAVLRRAAEDAVAKSAADGAG